jgi:hypothetical protein
MAKMKEPDVGGKEKIRRASSPGLRRPSIVRRHAADISGQGKTTLSEPIPGHAHVVSFNSVIIIFLHIIDVIYVSLILLLTFLVLFVITDP